jgi:hypothetical protein
VGVVGEEGATVLGARVVGDRLVGVRVVVTCVEGAGVEVVGVEGATVLGAGVIGDEVVVAMECRRRRRGNRCGGVLREPTR